MWQLWIILGLLVIGLIILVIVVGLPPEPVNIGVIVPSCSQTLENLPEITASQFLTCETLEGKPDPQRFYDKINDWTILPLDPQIVPSAQQICIQYCSQVQLPFACLSEDSVYLSCMEKLIPEECSDPAVPVARNGTLEYYVIGRGKVSCY